MNDRSEIIAKKKDGTEFLAEANISLVTVLGEKIYTVVLRDISERLMFEKRLQESLNEKEQVEEDVETDKPEDGDDIDENTQEEPIDQ